MKGGVLVFLSLACLAGAAFSAQDRGEEIVYAISPFGTAVYQDRWLVEREGRMLKLITFRTRVTGFRDLEKIYADPETGWPIRVERYIAWPFSKEELTEEYAPAEYSLVIKKYVGGKEVKRYDFKADGPIHNAILLPFYLRGVDRLVPGWSYDIRLPQAFKVTLVSIDDMDVAGKKYKAYHFVSEPKKFEIWISCDARRIPLVIKGVGGLGYTMRMKAYGGDGDEAPS